MHYIYCNSSIPADALIQFLIVSTFEGEFKNNKDYEGTWTDKDGKILSTVKAGDGGYL